MIVPRTVRSIQLHQYRDPLNVDRPLRNWRGNHGYVLMGEAGIGKSTEFKLEAKQVGTLDTIPARYFLQCNLQDFPQWQNGPIFIDGLDELRLHSQDSQNVILQIIERLKILGNPQFRLSIRSGSWLTMNEMKELSYHCSGQHIPILQLNPITWNDIKRIMSYHNIDSDSFIQKAHDHQVAHLLFNPLLLKFFMTLSERGKWPDSLLEVFQKICSVYLQQYRIQSRKGTLSESDLFNGVGKLSALMLLGNQISWTIDDEKSDEVFSIMKVHTRNTDTVYSDIASRLFQGDRTCRISSHRILGEFAGAYYLSKKVRDHLSARRILALFTGSDGFVYSDLRGLLAWLVCISPRMRSYVIEDEPTALIYDGDISTFSDRQRKQLLGELQKKISPLNISLPSVSFGAFAGRKAGSCIWELTKTSQGANNKQVLIDLLLHTTSCSVDHFTEGSERAFLAASDLDVNSLLSIIRNSNWPSSVRYNAILTLPTFIPNQSNLSKTLNQLLDEVNNKYIEDNGGHLRNILLDYLYPSTVTSSEIWNCLPPYPAEQDVYYRQFFMELVNKSGEDDIIELLNVLCLNSTQIIPKLDLHQLIDISVILLSKVLKLHGTKRAASELYRWFDLVEFNLIFSHIVPRFSSLKSLSRLGVEAIVEIQTWLNEHPKIQMELIEQGLLTHQSEIGTAPLLDMIGLKFVGYHPQDGFRQRCLSHAVHLVDSHPKLAYELARWAKDPIDVWGTPLTDDIVLEVISDSEKLLNWNQKRLERPNPRQEGKKHRTGSAQPEESPIYHHRVHELNYIREHITELSEGRCTSNILHKLASLYFQDRQDPRKNSMSSMRSYLGGDQKLLDASISGFRALLTRDDLPDLTDISNYHLKGQRSLYSLAFLAGMEEGGENAFSTLSEVQKQRALGFLFVTGLVDQETSSSNQSTGSPILLWYKEAVLHHPKAVADVMVSIHRAAIQSKRNLPNPYLLRMASDQIYSEVASLGVFQMFLVFPTRCNAIQLKSLSLVLRSALVHNLSKLELQKIILYRLDRKNMDAGQRAQWLCAGIAISEDHCLGLLADFLSEKGESRLHYVMDFLNPDLLGMIFKTIKDWSSKDISLLVQVLGRWTDPPMITEDENPDNDQENKGQQLDVFLMECLIKLGKRTDRDAIDELQGLSLHSELRQWKKEILQVQQKQKWRHQVERWECLSLLQIQNTLDGGSPVNGADLSVISTQVLQEYAHCVRNRKPNRVHQFWQMNLEKAIPTKPQCFNHCRDMIVTSLQKKFNKYGVTVQLGEEPADGQRFNIHLTFDDKYWIPIELIGNDHHKIWRAISENLVSEFLYDPFSDGYGVYLVLWFGPQYMRVPLPSGQIPQSPEELRILLQDQLPLEAKRHISIIIMDVSLSR